MFEPDPNDKHPLAGFPRVCFIKNTNSNPNIFIGAYTYYDDPEDAEDFERNVLYLPKRAVANVQYTPRWPRGGHLHLVVLEPPRLHLQVQRRPSQRRLPCLFESE